MKIGINALSIIPNNIGGGEVYLVNLIENMAQLDTTNSFYLFISKFNRGLFNISKKNFFKVKCNLPNNHFFPRIVYEQTMLPYLTNKLQLDVLHSPANYLPLFNNKRNILTIQHLINYYHPKFFPLWKRAIYNPLVKRSALKANIVIANSDSTNSQITKRIGVPAENIRTIYHGKSPIFKPIEKEIVEKQLKKFFSISDDYILMISTKNPQKNPIEIIRAFAYLKLKYKKPLKLVQVGLKSSVHERMFDEIEKHKLSAEIFSLGYISHDKMPVLYNGAQALLFPSIGEDFGLPLVEAMACGCPVITSNIYAPPEIVGDAGLIVDPYNNREIAEAIYSILENPELREVLIRRGLERANAFSWETTAKKTLDIYEEVFRKSVIKS
ncbi:MAG: glycosyltransferase family 1 protein [Syntrophales bacterium]|jgi:glycosyltransferase involved in cell wall biosynthesis